MPLNIKRIDARRGDAQAAIAFVRSRVPGERVGVVGVSQGGGAVLIANPPMEVDAAVLKDPARKPDRLLTDLSQLGPMLFGN